MKRLKSLIVLTFSIMGMMQTADAVLPPQTTFYTAPNGSGTACTSSAPCTLRTALGYAEDDGHSNIIYVGSGTYTLSGTGLPFLFRENHGRRLEAKEGETAILDGGHESILLDVQVHDSAPVLNTYLTIRNLTFLKGGNGGTNGGGLYIDTSDKNILVTIDSCRFIDNINPSHHGGAAYLNSKYAKVVITGSIIRSNQANGLGGGLYIKNSFGDTTIKNSEFSENVAASGSAGGLYHSTLEGTLEIVNSIFAENSATGYGGGIYSAVYASGTASIVNNTVIGNIAGSYGGGVYIQMIDDSSSHTYLVNNIAWNNSASTNGDDICFNNGINADGTLSNNLYGPGPEDFFYSGTLSNSSFIQLNPRLFGPITLIDGRKSLRLLRGSPAIDAGDNTEVTETKDYEGAQRIEGSGVNLGAVEVIANPVLAPIYFLLFH